MKKNFLNNCLSFTRRIFVLLIFLGISGYLNAQTDIDLNNCAPATVNLQNQEVGVAVNGIPAINAVHTSGGTLSICIVTADIISPFTQNFCTGSCTSPCTNPVSIGGININVSGATVTISGTPNASLAGTTISFTLRGHDGTNPDCDRNYTFNIASKGSGHGEPHMTTVDGAHYDLQSVGEFILLRGDKDDNFEIQARLTAVATNGPGTDPYTGLSTCVSINTAVAARVGTHLVTYQPNINGQPDSSGMQLRVDGALTTLGEDGLDLGSGGRIMKLSVGDGIEIDFPNGASLVISSNWWSHYGVWYLNIDVYRTMATKGIMGVIAPRSWLPKLPDGTSVGPMPNNVHDRFVQLYGTFDDAWRVTDQSSLFDYAPGTSTATFTDKNWPQENSDSCGIPNHIPQNPIEFQVAVQLCRDIVDSNMKANAIFDVMLTGEPSFAKAYLTTQLIQAGTTETTVNASKDTTKYEESVTFTATVTRKYSAEKDILAGTVEFIVDGKVFKQVKLDANGLAILTTTSLDVGRHQIAAIFIPDSDSTDFSSSSLNITHTVLAGDAGPISHQWWFWLIILLIIAGIIIALLRKKKSL